MLMRAFLESTPIRSRGFLPLVLSSLIAGLVLPTAVAQTKTEKPVDYVIFKNGDKLTGTLERAIGDSLIFKSDIVGEVTIPLDKVQELHSEGSFVVLKKDEKITRTTKQPGNMTFSDNSVTVNDTKTGPETVPTKDLAFIIDKSTYNKEITENTGFFHRWDGSITGGFTSLQSTSFGQTFTAGANLVRAVPTVPFLPPRTRTTFNLLETYGRPDDDALVLVARFLR